VHFWLRAGGVILLLAGSGYAFLDELFSPPTPTMHLQEAVALSPYEEERKSLNYLNELRIQAGMSAFLENSALKKAARSHANYLALHQKIGHYEEAGLKGFTGKTPSDRVLAAGYQSRVNLENVSNNVIGYKASIEGLFSAIYHRFGFLDFQVDEIGVGVAQNPNYHDKTAYVYNMGIYEINDLCQGEGYQGKGAYTYHICKEEKFRIKKSRFDKAYHACYKRNKRVVIYPFDQQEEVPPAFFDELPDPLPLHRVSGFPISIQFNPYYFNRVQLKRFSLFQGDKEITQTKIYDHISDINGLFKRNEFALFPLKRLAWGSRYRVEVVYRVDGEDFTKVWHFWTKKLSSTPIMIEDKKSQVGVSNKRETILYFKPLHAEDILENIQYDTQLDLSFIDKNTIKIRTDAKRGARFKLNISGREVILLVE
jgi:uncharacterized protein YkwD